MKPEGVKRNPPANLRSENKKNTKNGERTAYYLFFAKNGVQRLLLLLPRAHFFAHFLHLLLLLLHLQLGMQLPGAQLEVGRR